MVALPRPWGHEVPLGPQHFGSRRGNQGEKEGYKKSDGGIGALHCNTIKPLNTYCNQLLAPLAQTSEDEFDPEKFAIVRKINFSGVDGVPGQQASLMVHGVEVSMHSASEVPTEAR
jgi:hypothetical protein